MARSATSSFRPASNCQPDILLADEIERLGLPGSLAAPAVGSGAAVGAGSGLKPREPRNCVDPPGQDLGADAGRRLAAGRAPAASTGGADREPSPRRRLDPTG